MTETTRREAEELVLPEGQVPLPAPGASPGGEGEGSLPEPVPVEERQAPVDSEPPDTPFPEPSAEVPTPSPEARRRDPVVMVAAVALVAFLLLGWVALVQVGGLRRDVAAVGARVDAVEARLAEGDAQQARAALRRLEAELQGLRETLPPALGAELDAAAEALGRVKAGVDTRP